MPASRELTAKIRDLVIKLPEELVYRLAEAVDTQQQGDWTAIRSASVNIVAQPAVRKQVFQLVELWASAAPHLSPGAMATTLRAAAEVEAYHRRHEQLELVWSGPDTQVIPLRRTAQALRQLIDEASEQLHIVSFAVYRISAIAEALIRAATRGVAICIYLETPEASQDKITYDTIKALGEDVTRRSTIYVWPLEQRRQTSDGKYGSLHAKVAVADTNRLLISSANLTEYAMKLNMEMGVLIRGGPLPAQVTEHLKRLVEAGVFQEA